MSNRRLGPPINVNKKSDDEVKEVSTKRMTTYNQPTKGVKLTEYELSLVEESIAKLRDVTGKNITFSKVIRSMSYLLEDDSTIVKLSSIITNRIH
mgnify:CR=1 FL=1